MDHVPITQHHVAADLIAIHRPDFFSREAADEVRAIMSSLDEHTVVLIEHNMNIVMDISDTVTVMQMGRVLAEGLPHDIRSDDRVRTAYLGNMITGGKA